MVTVVTIVTVVITATVVPLQPVEQKQIMMTIVTCECYISKKEIKLTLHVSKSQDSAILLTECHL